MSSNERFSLFPRTEIDDAIDRAVSDMVQLDPHPGLRRRVLSRLERSSRPRRLSAWGSWELVSAAAVLMIIVAVVGGRMRQTPVELAHQPSAPPAPVALSAPVAPPAPSAPVALSAPVAPAPAAPLARSATAQSEAIFGARRDRVSAATAERMALQSEPVENVPPVHEQDSIALAPIVMRPLPQMPELRIAPIEIQRITVPALSPPR